MIRNGWNNIINGLAVQEELQKKGLAIADNGLNGEPRKLCEGFFILVNNRDSGLRVLSEQFPGQLCPAEMAYTQR